MLDLLLAPGTTEPKTFQEPTKQSMHAVNLVEDTTFMITTQELLPLATFAKLLLHTEVNMVIVQVQLMDQPIL
jgi:hypothetical protein